MIRFDSYYSVFLVLEYSTNIFFFFFFEKGYLQQLTIANVQEE